MTGIAGSLFPRGRHAGAAGNGPGHGPGDGPQDRSGVRRMMAALAHRGPDGTAWAEDGPAALGHAWRDCTGRDLPGPRRLRPGGPVLVADLRLDAPEALAGTLGLPPATPDPDLVLQAWDRWGLDLLERIDGDFALALWDPARRALFCARDRFGVKPLFFRCDAEGFRFASEPGALLALRPGRPEPDPLWVAEYLTGVSTDPGRTAHAGIRSLEPAHLLRSDGQEVTLRRYWTLAPAPERPADVAPALREALSRSVAARMQGGPTGAMLSGGLDSSAICCLAAAQGQAGAAAGPAAAGLRSDPPGGAGTGARDGAPGHPDRAAASPGRQGPAPDARLPVFSLVFDDFPEVDESAHIAAVLARGGFAPHRIGPPLGGAFDGAGAVLAEQQQPPGAMGLATTRGLYACADRAGLRVLLNGHGGDEVMSDGIERLIELASEGRWARLWHETRGAAALCGQGRADMLLELLSAHAPPRLVRAVARRLRGAAGRHDRTAWRRIVHPDLARDTDLVARRRALASAPAEGLSPAMQMHLDRLRAPGMAAAFDTLDRAAARQGIEARYPFFDRRVVELCLGQPASAKLSGGRTRALLREAMRGVLPETVRLRRDKADFWPVALRMLRHPRSLQRIDALAADPGPLAAYVDVDMLRAHVARLHAGEAEPALLFELWRAAWLSAWLSSEPEAAPRDRAVARRTPAPALGEATP